MEVIIVFAITLASVLCLAAGLLLTGRAPQDSCGAAACSGACDVCPRRKEGRADG